MEIDLLSARIDSLLSRADRAPFDVFAELIHGTLSVMHAMYGKASAQELDFKQQIEVNRKTYGANEGAIVAHGLPIVRGCLQAMKGEISTGFFGSVADSITGDVLTDLVKLAKSTLEDDSEKAANVAAVLVAAAFEDTVRRVSLKFKIPHVEKLADLLNTMKDRQVLQGPQVGIAQTYLSFRNRALHADWTHIDRPSINSCLAFTEGLILKHLA